GVEGGARGNAGACAKAGHALRAGGWALAVVRAVGLVPSSASRAAVACFRRRPAGGGARAQIVTVPGLQRSTSCRARARDTWETSVGRATRIPIFLRFLRFLR